MTPQSFRYSVKVITPQRMVIVIIPDTIMTITTPTSELEMLERFHRKVVPYIPEEQLVWQVLQQQVLLA
jgi:hypothetical protein